MVIYIDILFAINMLMDLTIIWTAGMLMKERIVIHRILAGAASGAFMYIITLYRPYINGFIQTAVMLMAISLSLIIAYKPNNMLRLLKLILISVIVSYMAAGMIFAILCFKTFYTENTVAQILNNFSFHGVLQNNNQYCHFQLTIDHVVQNLLILLLILMLFFLFFLNSCTFDFQKNVLKLLYLVFFLLVALIVLLQIVCLFC